MIKENQELLAKAIENYINNPETRPELEIIVEQLNENSEFKSIELFSNILTELREALADLSRKELKQRILIIRSYQ